VSYAAVHYGNLRMIYLLKIVIFLGGVEKEQRVSHFKMAQSSSAEARKSKARG